jgi:hypothetical protein
LKKAFIMLVLFLGPFFLFAEDPFVIGKLGGEGELIFPRQIEEGPDGHIYIYDQMDAFIKIYDGEGKFLRKIGGRGQGPGEIQRADGVFFGFLADGKLYFTEFFGGHPWISVVELSGEFVRAIKIDIQERFGIQRAYTLPDGRFVVQFVFIGQPEQTKDYFLHKTNREIAVLDSGGGVQSRFLKREIVSQISLLDQGGDSPIPFTPGYFWVLQADDHIVFSDGLSTQLQVYGLNGERVRSVDTSLPKPERVTKNDLESWKKRRKEMMATRNPDWYNRLGKVIELYKKSIYALHPNISGMDITPEGNFLLTGLQDQGQRTLTYWLFDGGGKEMARIETGVMIGRLSGSYIVYASIDDDGVVSLFGLKRTGSETDDLLRIPQANLTISDSGR